MRSASINAKKCLVKVSMRSVIELTLFDNDKYTLLQAYTSEAFIT